MPGSRTGLTEQDRAEWAQYARQVTPLSGRHPPPPPLAPTTPAPAQPRAAAPGSAASAQRVVQPIIVGRQPPGVDNATWQRFRTGKLAASRTLDLHGRTAQRAFHALTRFLRTGQSDGLRCVEVITGRGLGETGGVLRRELPLWLNLAELRPLVLAAAHPHPANPGSVRILLRRLR